MFCLSRESFKGVCLSAQKTPFAIGQKKARIHQLRLEEGAKKAAEELEKYDPNNDPNISGDPYKTLFVARLNYETTESRVKREFEAYGPIKRVGFVEYPVKGLKVIPFCSVRGLFFCGITACG
ncbi:putative nucleotide-binding alpha-beta plait domain superfamily, RNA-binding domain superfamily [Helianthus anomalus]